MSTLPLEVHEVLEDEYVSMYGPLALPANEYTAEQILDPKWGERIACLCGLDLTNGLLAALNALVAADSADQLRALEKSPQFSEAGRAMLEDYVRANNRRIVDDAFRGAVRSLADIRLDNVYGAVHGRVREGRPRAALCISGGGIRSATFALGILQGLASAKVLDKFDYLSTVSGGGYIGSWLSSWIRRHPRGVSGVQEDLQRADTAFVDPKDADVPNREVPERKINPEPLPLRHLRAYSNYLSPRLGLFSGDSWTLASLYIRNLLLNLLVLVPLLACALAFPRMFSWVLHHDRALPPVGWAWLSVGLTTLGFAYLGWKRPVEQDQKAKERKHTVTTDGTFLAFCVLPLVLASAALAVFWARVQEPNWAVLKTAEGLTVMGAAFLGMTFIPYALYYSRYLFTLPSERHASFASSKEFRRAHLKKQLTEFAAVIIAVAVTAGLLWLLAEKVFDDPVRIVPATAIQPPIERAGADAAPQAQLYVCFIVPALLLVFFVQASIFVGLSSKHNEDSDREWWGRAGAWLIAVAVGLALFSAIAVFGPIAFYYAPVILASVGGGAGLVAALLGYSDKTPANQKQKEEGGMASKASGLASAIAVPLFIAALLAAISLGSTWLIQQFEKPRTPAQLADFARKAMFEARFTAIEKTTHGGEILYSATPRLSMPAVKALDHLATIQHTSGGQVLIFWAVAAVGVILSLFIGVNKFSMQALYRNRIVRAYLGASRYKRDTDRFTGFDENDNLQMWELRPEVLWVSSLKDAAGFAAELKSAKDGVAAYLYGKLDVATKKALDDGVNPTSIDALVLNLNSILDDCDFAAEGYPPPAWCAPQGGKANYSAALRNRATIDAAFAKSVTPMAPPADAAGAPGPDFRRAPLHVINTTLNLTSGENLAWQQRMGASLTVSPLHTGSLFLGYRNSRQYGGSDGISLGTAVAISGAAASPNMGYNSSPTMAFLLTFFNIRLGSWLGNPGLRGQSSYTKKHPTSGLLPMFEELTGNSTDKSKWVYLSDGGHFENLALYEMVLRRCHTIVVSDGGCDPKVTFDDLGNAIRKIRTDMGVPIDIIGAIDMFPRASDGKPVQGQYVAFGKIRYKAADKNGEDGLLVYIKPGVYESEYFPRDVYNYAQQSLEFPHEPTSDQFFSESQFESYRALGRHAINEIRGLYKAAEAQADPSDVAQFAKALQELAEPISRLKPEQVVANALEDIKVEIRKSAGDAAESAKRDEMVANRLSRLAIAVRSTRQQP